MSNNSTFLSSTFFHRLKYVVRLLKPNLLLKPQNTDTRNNLPVTGLARCFLSGLLHWRAALWRQFEIYRLLSRYFSAVSTHLQPRSGNWVSEYSEYSAAAATGNCNTVYIALYSGNRQQCRKRTRLCSAAAGGRSSIIHNYQAISQDYTTQSKHIQCLYSAYCGYAVLPGVCW